MNILALVNNIKMWIKADFSLVVRLYTMFSPRIFLHQNPDSSINRNHKAQMLLYYKVH